MCFLYENRCCTQEDNIVRIIIIPILLLLDQQSGSINVDSILRNSFFESKLKGMFTNDLFSIISKKVRQKWKIEK